MHIMVICFFTLQGNGQTNLNDQKWIHGSKKCRKNKDEPIQVVQYDENTWILRQNMCSNYEAPFMFLFLGSDKALLMDTGAATKKRTAFPLFKTINTILSNNTKHRDKPVELIVAHTHRHSDHYAADAQFKEKPNTKLVGLDVAEVIAFFKFVNWPEDIVDFELGNRTIKIIPIPGHQEASIAVYDSSSELLLTGDTFYPGRLYVDNWSSFRKSINKLANFAKHHQVKYILGNHIEMSTSNGVDYPMGSTYHPEEQKLPLTVEDLVALQVALNNLGNNPTKEVHKNFIIYPK